MVAAASRVIFPPVRGSHAQFRSLLAGGIGNRAANRALGIGLAQCHRESKTRNRTHVDRSEAARGWREPQTGTFARCHRASTVKGNLTYHTLSVTRQSLRIGHTATFTGIYAEKYA
jgi:hypothetical protein